MTVEHLTQELDSAAREYHVSREVEESLRRKKIAPILGPFAVGKTTTMEKAIEIDDEFTRVRSFTTRERRTGEGEETYNFLPHTRESLEKILGSVTARELVQFMVHPTTGHVYGSHLDDYGPYKYAMLDVVPKALPALEALPFEDMQKIELVTPAEEWRARMDKRLRDGDPDDIRKRLQEGMDNIEWAMDQGDNIAWLQNGGRPIDETARELTGLVRGETDWDPDARQVGDALLTELRQLHENGL